MAKQVDCPHCKEKVDSRHPNLCKLNPKRAKRSKNPTQSDGVNPVVEISPEPVKEADFVDFGSTEPEKPPQSAPGPTMGQEGPGVGDILDLSEVAEFLCDLADNGFQAGPAGEPQPP